MKITIDIKDEDLDSIIESFLYDCKYFEDDDVTEEMLSHLKNQPDFMSFMQKNVEGEIIDNMVDKIYSYASDWRITKRNVADIVKGLSDI